MLQPEPFSGGCTGQSNPPALPPSPEVPPLPGALVLAPPLPTSLVAPTPPEPVGPPLVELPPVELPLVELPLVELPLVELLVELSPAVVSAVFPPLFSLSPPQPVTAPIASTLIQVRMGEVYGADGGKSTPATERLRLRARDEGTSSEQ